MISSIPGLDGLYQTIVSYADEDQIGEVIDSFNNGYLRTPLSTRQELSQSALRPTRPDQKDAR